ncbi:nucleotidyltransferase substrate binding protein [uncultured Methanospirillum sp.]|uniref:nucleotidyltransferase substrate binding protein n=1 Tax=uncultured Methanospirillum sp. TaxID=262503 RepID=UPI0029C615E4|nr:nucleotidyltransferase substrate binding protein [uncultured Methanospirillum sp.]
MNTPDDIRYKQRFVKFCKTEKMLTEAVDLYYNRPLTPIEKQGFIKAFEFTFELAWKVMKDYIMYQGDPDVMGSRDAIRKAFSLGLIKDGDTWISMIASRNLTSHTYDEKTMEETLALIAGEYHPLFEAFLERMEQIADSN